MPTLRAWAGPVPHRRRERRAVSRILTGWHVCPAITGLQQTAGPKLVAVALKPCLRHATSSDQSRWSAVNTGLRDYRTKAHRRHPELGRAAYEPVSM
jgi:hypothetical protein